MEVAAAILLFFAIQWFAAAFGFILNSPISPLPFLIGISVAGFYVVWASPKRARDLLIFLGLIGGSLLLTLPVKDISWDGNSYHLDAIKSLSAGWNPFRQIEPPNAEFPQWLAYFSKGAWYSETSSYLLFGSLNITKYGAILLLFPPALIFYEALRERFAQKWLRLFWTLVFVLNPVAFYQLFTKYIDGQLGALLGVTVALLLIPKERRARAWYVALGSTIILLINIKLTGALFAAILIGGFLGFELLRRRLDRAAWAACIVGGLIAVFIGWNPYITQYVTNTITHRAPFYPTTYDELTHLDVNLPFGLIGKPPLEKMFISLFSRTEAYKEQPLHFKIPFTFDLQEAGQMIYWDVRIGGFGPLFGGIVLLMLAALIIGGHGLTWEGGVLALLLLVCTVINPEMWWARYVPGLWLIPVLIAIYNKPNGRRTVWLQALLGIALAANVLLTFVPVIARTLEIIRG